MGLHKCLWMNRAQEKILRVSPHRSLTWGWIPSMPDPYHIPFTRDLHGLCFQDPVVQKLLVSHHGNKIFCIPSNSFFLIFGHVAWGRGNMESGGPDMKETRGAQWGGAGRGGHCICELGHKEPPEGLPCWLWQDSVGQHESHIRASDRMTFTVASLLVLTFFCLPTSPEMTVGPPLRHLAVLWTPVDVCGRTAA